MKLACCLTILGALYDPDPNHIWNRVHRVLHVRVASDGQEYGADDLDPLLWIETKHLLTGESHRQALAMMDEFLAKHAERAIADPMRRAIFQHDLWSVFDWSDNPDPSGGAERRALQLRLARMIQRVALTRAEMEKLPDNLPAALNLSSWVPLIPRGGAPAAIHHTSEFSGRSAFAAFIRLPGGREETVSYLKRLVENQEQFPVGTKFALVRLMMLIDPEGNVVPTHFTESVQIRDADNSEFRLNKQTGQLVAVGPDEKRFSVFMTHGIDPFELLRDRAILEQGPPVLKSCVSCHRGGGIQSINTYARFGKPQELIFKPSELDYWTFARQAEATVYWKQRQHNLGLLQGLWLR